MGERRGAYVLSDKIKKDEMGRACSIYGGEERCICVKL